MAEETLTIKEIEEIKKLFKNGGESKKHYPPPQSGEKGVLTVISIIAVILAIIGGVYAMVQPMNLRINTLEETLNLVNTEYTQLGIISSDKHAESKSDRNQLNMQLQGLKGRLAPIEEWHTHWTYTIPARDATQDEKIQQLERRVSEISKGVHSMTNRKGP